MFAIDCNKAQCSSNQWEAWIKRWSAISRAGRVNFTAQPFQDHSRIVGFGSEEDVGILLEQLSWHWDAATPPKDRMAVQLTKGFEKIRAQEMFVFTERQELQHSTKWQDIGWYPKRTGKNVCTQTTVQASIFSVKGGCEQSILFAEVHCLNCWYALASLIETGIPASLPK